MLLLIGLVAAAALWLPAPEQAKTPAPQVTFFLHAQQKLPTLKLFPIKMVAAPPRPVIQSAPDGRSLLALIPQQAGQWELQRLTGWQNGALQAESLKIQGDESGDDRDYLQPEITPSPDGHYALVRISILSLGAEWKRTAIVLLIDLPAFRVIWRRLATDPLLANSRWAFADNQTVVAAEGLPPVRTGHPVITTFVPEDMLDRNPVSPGEHDVQALSLPDFQAGPSCHYSIKASSATKIDMQDDGCAELLNRAGASSAEQLPGLRQAANHIGGPAWPGCQFEDNHPASGLILYNCRAGHTTEKQGFFTRTEEERVVDSVSGETVLSLSFKPNEPYSATLASVDGHSYLVLLRNKLRVQVYQIR